MTFTLQESAISVDFLELTIVSAELVPNIFSYTVMDSRDELMSGWIPYSGVVFKMRSDICNCFTSTSLIAP